MASVYVLFGGSGGIGRALIERLRRREASLVVVGRDVDKLKEVEGDAVRTEQADASDFDQTERVIKDAAEREGRVDGVWNGAGSIFLKPAHLTSPDEFDDTLKLNLWSAFAVTRAAASVMRNQDDGGSIVLTSTVAAGVGLSNHDSISAAKAGVEGLTRASAATYVSGNVRINAVAPGLVDTPMASRLTSSDAARKQSEALHPLGRLGEPDDIARVVEWLITTDAAWVTGQVIPVDGGLSSLRVRSS